MRDKIINTLLTATQWLTAQLVADLVDSRSAANCSVYLKNLEAGGEAVSRLRKEGNLSIAEYRHRRRPDVEDCNPKQKKTKVANVKPAPNIDPVAELAAWRSVGQKHGVNTPHGMATLLGTLQRKAA